MGEEHIIETHFDVLLSTLKDAHKPLSAGRIATICGMREKDVVQWLYVLEKSGQVRIENRFNGINASWIDKDGEGKTLPAVSHSAIDVGRQSAFESDVKFARQRQKDDLTHDASKEKKSAVIVSPVAVDVGDSPPRISHELKLHGAETEENYLDAIEREAIEGEETIATEISPKPAFEREPLGEKEMPKAESWQDEFADGQDENKLELARAGNQDKSAHENEHDKNKRIIKDGKSLLAELEKEARENMPDAEVRES